MYRKIFLLLFFVSLRYMGLAQSADSVYNRYLDFNLARFQDEPEKVKRIGEQLIPVADNLPQKARMNFYYAIGKVYEDNGQNEKAIIYYEKVAAGVPDYYVAHRGLGYLYLERSRAIAAKLNATQTDAMLNKQLTDQYTEAVQKALPDLEKAQACDPSDETLAIIKTLYKNLKDTKALETLDTRLKQLSTHCIDILDDK